MIASLGFRARGQLEGHDFPFISEKSVLAAAFRLRRYCVSAPEGAPPFSGKRLALST
jgi:hypothetical protein